MEIDLFTPPMCCPTGICGPDVDDELMELNEVLLGLEEKGVEVNRYLLNQQPQAFMKYEPIEEIIKNEGTDGLPATLVDGDLLKKGDFPTREELEQKLDI